MKVVFNTLNPNNLSSIFYRQGLSQCSSVVLDDFEHYENFDVALFMTYREDLQLLKKVKKNFPVIKTGVCDPRGSKIIQEYLPYIDFFLVDSIEMIDFWSDFGKPLCHYMEYPEISQKTKKHYKVSSEKIILGYHGNIIHLISMFPKIIRAIEQLSEKYNIELWAAYNLKSFGKVNFEPYSGLKLKHIQWHENVYDEEFSEVDIGLVPGLSPLLNIYKGKKNLEVYNKVFLDTEDDYLLRCKMPSNPGRIIVFSRLRIPVVADFYPSAIQLIEHGKNGFLAMSSGGWYQAIESLINDHKLRNDFAENLSKKVNSLYDYEVQNRQFVKFLKKQNENDWKEGPMFEKKLQEKEVSLLKKLAQKRYYSRKYFEPIKRRLSRLFGFEYEKK